VHDFERSSATTVADIGNVSRVPQLRFNCVVFSRSLDHHPTVVSMSHAAVSADYIADGSLFMSPIVGTGRTAGAEHQHHAGQVRQEELLRAGTGMSQKNFCCFG
jgi:hypothetical protein